LVQLKFTTRAEVVFKKTFGKIASQGKIAEKELGKASIFSFTRVPRHVWYNSFSREGRLRSAALRAPA
jgi:hypothetical protein